MSGNLNTAFSIDISVYLFSPKFNGNNEVWHWVCEKSNGRQCVQPALTKEQENYAYNAGYINLINPQARVESEKKCH